jgi:glyoxylase-like metal-dependent hydrolase (beta-lactamase superfamily II)
MGDDVYEVLALRYARFDDRTRASNLLRAEPHFDAPMPIDFYVWVIRNADRTIVVDTGFGPEEAGRRGREVLQMPKECLTRVGVDAAEVEDVVVTHLHFDHAGTIGDFPRATFHLQESEMAFATGRHMGHAAFARPFSVEIVCDMVRAVFAGRVRFHDGDAEIAPGVSVHHVGGHSAGLQAVRVRTRRGWLVLASDVSHFYENIEDRNPFPIICHLGDMYEGFQIVERLSSDKTLLIPGHDPLVLARYPLVRPDLAGIAVRLDADPIQTW